MSHTPAGSSRRNLMLPFQRLLTIWRDEYDTAVNWPHGIRHLAVRVVVITIVDTLALVIAAYLLPQLTIDRLEAALAVTVIAGLLAFILRPIAFLILPQNLITTAILTIVFLGITLAVAAAIVPGVAFDNTLWAFVAAFIVAAVNAVLIPILGLDEDESFYRNSIRKLARARGDVDDRPGPGFLFIQVDGLAEPVIKNALRTGYMPFLAHWIRTGTHRLGRWEALAPSMTSSGQTGILHGNSAGIPAFRWWERDRNYLMVSNHPTDAFEIERRASGPNDLLRDGGASISNLVSGGAPRSVATNSQLASAAQGIRVEAFSLYLVNPYNITRGIVTFLYTVVLELFQARSQRQRGVEPRISRGMPFPLLRASASTVLRDMMTDVIIGEMYRGTPMIYADYLGYDEIAHHAGPERPESMDELIRVDRQVRTLARAAEGAPREYHIVLVSDHGQSQGSPFAERYGESLEQLIRNLMDGSETVLAATGDEESWGPVNAFFSEVVRSTGRTGAMARRALRNRSVDDTVGLGPADRVRRQRTAAAVAVPERLPDLVVAASGNLANIYFPGGPERMSLEAIEEANPGLMEGLVRHAGIGFALVRSERLGALAIGRGGIHYLDEGRVEGDDPLAVFGPHAAGNLRRLDSFEHVGDILLNSMYDPSTDEIAPFEHQVGAHGGLGGPQNHAFVMYPAVLEPREEPVSLVGADQVNAKFHEWVARARSGEAVGIAPHRRQGLAPEVTAVIGAEDRGSEPPVPSATAS
jgi:uncharacterized membrane protein YvlD (DUF360 family)